MNVQRPIANDQPQSRLLSGVILLAPFLGGLELVDEIENAGGLRHGNGDAKDFKQYEIDL